VPLSRSRDYLSIGEVLESIRSDFPDVTISKIRFLESEGLIAPERTASGYRKFYENDVKRLSYILSLQRDQFLPLKVIKERLTEFEADGREPPAGSGKAAKRPRRAAASADPGDVSLSRSELKKTTGLSEEQVAGLEEFGILTPSSDRYDGSDLIAAKAARGLFDFGIEPRHLRMYRQLADREASFVEQIVSPVTHKRHPDAHKEAAQSVQTLLQLSLALRESLVRSGLKELL
jgi:DNA-binding transcriptional MerR regulator